MKEITTVGTLLEHNGRILTLLRSEKEKSPNTWGLAAGRLEPGENPKETAVREIKEETGLAIKEEDLITAGIQEWKQPTFIVHFHTFRLPLATKPDIILDPEEHSSYDWKTPKEILALKNPISGLQELIREMYHTPN